MLIHFSVSLNCVPFRGRFPKGTFGPASVSAGGVTTGVVVVVVTGAVVAIVVMGSNVLSGSSVTATEVAVLVALAKGGTGSVVFAEGAVPLPATGEKPGRARGKHSERSG